MTAQAARRANGNSLLRLPNRAYGRAYRVRRVLVRVCPRVEGGGGAGAGAGVTVTGTHSEQNLFFIFYATQFSAALPAHPASFNMVS